MSCPYHLSGSGDHEKRVRGRIGEGRGELHSIVGIIWGVNEECVPCVEGEFLLLRRLVGLHRRPHDEPAGGGGKRVS